jgi:hypothetical protein
MANQPAWGQEPPDRAEASLRSAYFINARSFALSHRLKPGLHLEWSRSLDPRFRLGAALGSVLTGNSNYAVAGAYAVGSYTALSSGRFELDARFGLGVGYNAAILHPDLEAGFPVIPYGYLGLLASFRSWQGGRIGVELGDEQLGVVHLGLRLAQEL